MNDGFSAGHEDGGEGGEEEKKDMEVGASLCYPSPVRKGGGKRLYHHP